MATFKLKAGLHFEDGKRYKKDDLVVSPQDLVALFPQKFELVSAPAPALEKQFVENIAPEHKPIGKQNR